LRDAFGALTEQWRRDRVEEERKRKEKEASVKVKKAKGDAEEDKSKQEDERDMKKMFPDFHSEFVIKPREEDGEDDDDNGDQAMGRGEDRPFQSSQDQDNDDDDIEDNSYQTLNADQVESLVGSFISLYGGGGHQPAASNSDDDGRRTRLVARAFDAGSDLVSVVPLLGDPDLDRDAMALSTFALDSCITDLKM